MIKCGYNHIGCITMNGDLYMWGDNSNYKLGVGSKKEYKEKPTLVKTLKDQGLKIA